MQITAIDSADFLRGQGTVVVGGAGPLGSGVVIALRRAGGRVVVVDEASSGGPHDDLPDLEPPCFVAADLRDPASVARAFAEVNRQFDRLAAVVIVPDARGEQRASTELAETEWNDVIDRQLNAVFWSSQQAAQRMLTAGGGSIVAISSLAGVLVDKFDVRAHHHAANAAIGGLSKGLAVEWADRGVRVNVVAPGALRATGPVGTRVDDEQRVAAAVPMHRLAAAEEIVAVVLFLCSSASSYLTGQTLVADGGRGLLFD